MTIPPVLHYCWFGGQPKPPEVLRCMESWARVLPDHEVVEWTESDLERGDHYLDAALSQGLWSKVSNLVRLQVLRDQGGIYLDTDIELLRPFGRLMDEHCVVGFQQTPNDSDWVNNAVLLGSRGHPFLTACIDLTRDHFQRTGEFLRSPQVTTTVLKNAGLLRYGRQSVGGVRLVPVETFYPIAWDEDFSPQRVTSDSICIHHWHYSWKDPGRPVRKVGALGLARRLKRWVPERVRTSGSFLRARRQGALLSSTIRARWGAAVGERAARDRVLTHTAGSVASGPYAGMRCLPESHVPDLTAKLLGTFEMELHPWIERWTNNRYDIIVDSRCRDGFHSVGLARGPSGPTVHAWDPCAASRTLARRLAALNGMGRRVRVHDDPPWAILGATARPRALLLCSSGPEAEGWIARAPTNLLESLDLCIEDSEGADVTRIESALMDRLAARHRPVRTSHRGRRSSDCPIDHPSWSAATRLALVDECRGAPTSWTFLSAPAVDA